MLPGATDRVIGLDAWKSPYVLSLFSMDLFGDVRVVTRRLANL
jgi:hypothetical protein